MRSSDEEVRSRRAQFVGRCDRSKSHLPHDNLFIRQILLNDTLFHTTSPLKEDPSLLDVLTKLPVNSKLPLSAVSSMTDIYENTIRLYYALYEQMNEFYRKGAIDIDSTREAESIAHILIKNDDLPILIRCRALCILGCSDQGGYLFYAEESVRYAKLGLASDKVGDHKGDELAQLILESCEECLEGAKAAAAKSGSGHELDSDEEMEESEESDVEEDGGDDGGEEIVVWDADWDDERKAKASADDEARIAALKNAARIAEEGDGVRKAEATAGDAKGGAEVAGVKATEKQVENV
jgi:hypothetical protein